jgi:hypothetical protein
MSDGEQEDFSDMPDLEPASGAQTSAGEEEKKLLRAALDPDAVLSEFPILPISNTPAAHPPCCFHVPRHSKEEFEKHEQRVRNDPWKRVMWCNTRYQFRARNFCTKAFIVDNDGNRRQVGAYWHFEKDSQGEALTPQYADFPYHHVKLDSEGKVVDRK